MTNNEIILKSRVNHTMREHGCNRMTALDILWEKACECNNLEMMMLIQDEMESA